MAHNRLIPFRKLFRFPGILCFITLIVIQGPLEASVPEEDYFIFQENDKKGIRNSKHKVVVPAMYDDLGWSFGEFNPLDNVVGFQENGLWGLITLKNKKIADAKYRNLYPLNRELIAASKLQGEQEKYGVIDIDGLAKTTFDFGRLNMFNNLIVTSKQSGNQERYGMLNLTFQEVIPFNYNMIRSLNNRFALITIGEFSGLVNANGKVVVEPRYHEIELHGNSCKAKLFDSYEIRNEQYQLIATHQAQSIRKAAPGILVKSNPTESQLLTTRGEVVATYPETEIVYFENHLAVIKKHNLFGVIDSSGRILISPEYHSIWIKNGYIGIEENNGDWKLLNAELKQISRKAYQQINPALEGLFQIKRLDSWGYIDANGEEILPPQYQETKPFEDGVAFANYLGSWGLIDQQGNWLIKPRYDELEKLNDDTYVYQKAGQYGLVKTNQAEVYSTSNKLYPAATGAIEKNTQGNHALISSNGEMLLSLQYRSIRQFNEDPRYFLFENEQGSGIYNITTYTFFQDTAIQEMRTLNEGYIGIKLNNQYGLIDLNGKLRIANRYEDVGVFNEDMLPIKIRGRWGYVDRIERLVVQPLYQSADHFINGLAIVSQNGKFGLIDKRGKVLVKLDYDRLERLPNGLFIGYKGKKAGLINAQGKVLIYPGYATLEILDNGHVKASKNGKQGLINKNGLVLIPTTYDSVAYDHHNELYYLTKKYPVADIQL